MGGHLSSGEYAHQSSRAPFTGIGGSDVEGLFLAEADHRIANHLALLTGYVRLKAADLARQSAAPSRDSVHLLLEGVGAQIDAVSRLHRRLAADGSRASADLGEHLHVICASFASGLSGAITLIEDLPFGCAVRSDQVLPLTQIVAEVVTNALKHAHPGGEAGAILVRCRKDDMGAALIEIIDDGAGLPETFNPQTDGGLGFRLLQALGRKLGALIAFESTKPGLRFRLTLPAEPA
jgi:two-component sensor histidine kinase